MTTEPTPYQDDSSSESGDEPVREADEGEHPLQRAHDDMDGTKGSSLDNEPAQNAQSDTSEETALTEPQPAAMSPRAYQVEMLEASLKQNIIVAVSRISDMLALDAGSPVPPRLTTLV